MGLEISVTQTTGLHCERVKRHLWRLTEAFNGDFRSTPIIRRRGSTYCLLRSSVATQSERIDVNSSPSCLLHRQQIRYIQPNIAFQSKENCQTQLRTKTVSFRIKLFNHMTAAVVI